MLCVYPTCLCVCTHLHQTWRGLRTVVWECLNGTDLSSWFASDKQATLESPVSILTPRAIRYTNTHTQHICFVYWAFLYPFPSTHSVELLTERASWVCGRSTRRHPTPNRTWWGHPLLSSPPQQPHTHLQTKTNEYVLLFCCSVLADRVGSATQRPAVISPSLHPPASLPQPDSPMITGWHVQWEEPLVEQH